MKNRHAYTSVIGHLENFRKSFINCISAVLVLFPCAWPFSKSLLSWITMTLCPPEMGAMYYTHPMGFFFLRLKISFILAITIAIPIIAWNIWTFILPALYKKEKKLLQIFSLSSLLLFTFGASLVIFFIFPTLMRFSVEMQTSEIRPLFNASSCVDMLIWLILGFGLCFQLPIILLGAIKIGLISVVKLKMLRPYIMVAIFIVAGLLTPPDIISQLTMAIPTALLFELSLLIGKYIERKNYAKA